MPRPWSLWKKNAVYSDFYLYYEYASANSINNKGTLLSSMLTWGHSPQGSIAAFAAGWRGVGVSVVR